MAPVEDSQALVEKATNLLEEIEPTSAGFIHCSNWGRFASDRDHRRVTEVAHKIWNLAKEVAQWRTSGERSRRPRVERVKDRIWHFLGQCESMIPELDSLLERGEDIAEQNSPDADFQTYIVAVQAFLGRLDRQWRYRGFDDEVVLMRELVNRLDPYETEPKAVEILLIFSDTLGHLIRGRGGLRRNSMSRIWRTRSTRRTSKIGRSRRFSRTRGIARARTIGKGKGMAFDPRAE